MKMEEWKECKLGDICKSNIHSYSEKDNWAFVNYLDTGNITENKISDIQFIDLSSESLPSRARRKVQLNDIIYSTVRPNQKHFGIIKNKPENFLVSTGFAVLHINKIIADPNFIFYNLIQNENTESLHAIAEQTTSAYPAIKPSDIENLSIKLPPLPTQQKIARILSSLDDKIELNNKINTNLEQQAGTLFKNWFVDFEPFGGKMPDGWKMGKLSDIADITMGQSPDGKSYNEEGIGTVFYQGRAEFGNRFPTRRLFTTEPKRIAKKFDTLMSVRAPVGDTNIANEDCCIGRGLAAIHSKANHQSFVHYTVLALRSQLDVFNGEGTVFGCINRDALNNMEVIIPAKSDLDKFEEIVASFDADIFNRSEENSRLKDTRDSLLPKLMNGEIEV